MGALEMQRETTAHGGNRSEELIVTASGETVAPTPIEDELRAYPLVGQAVLIGEARPFVTALITVDPQAFHRWRTNRAEPDRTVRESTDHPVLRAAMQVGIDRVNATRSHAASIRAFAILAAELTVAAGELTPTLEVRRSVVEERYADTIEGLYRPTAPLRKQVTSR